MDERFLIELLEDFVDPQNDNGQIRNALLERCLKASGLELKEFFNELSQLLRESPNIYLPILQTFVTYLREEHSKAARRRNLQNTAFFNFVSKLITLVITQNLFLSDILGFGGLINDCVELLWRGLDDRPTSSNGNKINNLIKSTTKLLLTEILNVDGVLGVLVSESPGRRCLKRVLFNFNLIKEINQKEWLRAVDVISALLENCDEHNGVLSRLLECKACTALLETLKNHKSSLNAEKNSILPPNLLEMVKIGEKLEDEIRSVSNTDESMPLSIQDESHLALLNMKAPRKFSELPNFCRDLEQRKIDSLKDLIDFFPCENCHKQALMYFSPEKYSSLMEDGELTDIENEPSFRLPFEFNESDGLGPWDILLSEDAIRDMQRLDSPHKTKAVMKKLGQVSSGAWDKHGLRSRVISHDIPIYEEDLGNDDLKILWQIDYGFSIRNYSDVQLVKIWSIATDLNETKDNLKEVRKVYAPENNYRYKINKICGGVFLPKCFDDDEGMRYTNGVLHGSEMDNEKLLEVHRMLVTNKFTPLSKNLFKSLVLGGSGFTFNVSKIEYEIINNPTSAIVIGRSGTGKTTCIVFRLVASYLNNKLYKTPSSRSNCGNYKRQIFITVSHSLCRRVKNYFNKLRESAEFAEKKMSLTDFNDYARRKEMESEDIEVEDDEMLEEGDEKELEGVPNSFRQLTDEHFPLFITYDKFSKMLQETYDIDVRKCTTQKKPDAENDDVLEEEEEESRFNHFTLNKSDVSWFHFVDYDLFQNKYWPRFSDYYRKKLDCELVFSEFFVIKGTNPEVDYLSRESYRAISIKKFPVFRYNRDEVYDLFERYEKMKAQNYDYDSVDLTLAILRAAKKKVLRGPLIHEVYIDECQDNQIADLALILKLFKRADNVFMAGDIAQCIARGSSFRFQNLRELMFNWERNRFQNDHNIRNVIEPKQFELNINFRSHNGILQIASSVIDLIRKFFPDSIDHLSPERSEIGGPRPIFFKGFHAETFLFDVFSVDDKVAECIEFGAEQVIIVRNDEAKKRIGKVGIVMTVFEAKGMEFNDVLLYNFFTDSPARQKWRLILTALDDHSKGIQTFSHEKHYILSSELKHLYVAVTRARQHLWIFDEDSELSDPIRIYWERNDLIKVIQSLEEINTLPTLVKKSSSREWNRKGKMFFERRQYELAIFCFKNSGNEESRKLAHAYHLQQIARTSFVNNSDGARANFISAAKAFLTCSRPNQAASCYQDIGMHKEAGDVYAECDLFELAANCYQKANMWDKAGEFFQKVKKYTEAVVAYKNGGFYKKVIDLMQRHREEIDEKVFRRVSRLVNIHYRRENDKEMSKMALSVLPTQEEQIELLRDHAPEELLEVCEKSGKFRDAAKDLCSRGKFKEATDMFARSNDEKDIIEALQCILHLCRTNILKNITTGTMNQDILQELYNLNCKAQGIATKVKSQLSKTLTEEFRLYLVYVKKDLNEVHKCIQFFRDNGEFVNEFRAINMWLQIIPQSDSLHPEYWKERLQYLLRLCDLAFPYIRVVTQPQNTRDAMKIYKDFEDIFLVYKVKNRLNKRQIIFEHPLVDKMQIKKEDTVDSWHFYDVDDVRQAILQFLASHIFELILDASQKGRDIPDISSEFCHKFSSCQKPDCYYYHVVPSPLVLKQRLTLACLHYTVIQQWELLYHRRLIGEEQSQKVRPTQRKWAENLIRVHFRYQSPQTSCPEVIHMMIARLPKRAYYGLIDLANKIWLKHLSQDPGDFSVMLKCMFVYQLLWYEWGVDSFYWEMSKTITLSHPEELPAGFGYFYGYYEAIPIGKRLSLFFQYLNYNKVLKAIKHLRIFIQHTIEKYSLVKMEAEEKNKKEIARSFDASCDLVYFIEFKLSLIFASVPGYCSFCIPRSYLVNYIDAFTAEPLVNKYRYRRESYWAEIKNSLEQIQQLLEVLLYNEFYYLTTILRLIRLLVLIGRNDINLAPKVMDVFKDLSREIHSTKAKKYLEEKNIYNLIKILKDDIKETDCDSLVIVHYDWGGPARFNDLERFGVPIIKYKSTEEFHCSLRKIMSPVVTEESTETDYLTKQLLPQRADISTFNVGGDEEDGDYDEDKDNEQLDSKDSELASKNQAWFRQIQDSFQAQKAAETIQVWFRRAYERRQKYQQQARDQILDKIYNDVKDFCWNSPYWEDAINQRGEAAVRKYHMLLRSLMVDIVVRLNKLQDTMDKVKNKLQKTINNRSTDSEKLESCLNLEDDLKHTHYENVKSTLESLSTENSTKHKEADIEWLKNELHHAEKIIDQVKKWLNDAKSLV